MYGLEFFIWDIGLTIQFDTIVKKGLYFILPNTDCNFSQLQGLNGTFVLRF